MSRLGKRSRPKERAAIRDYGKSERTVGHFFGPTVGGFLDGTCVKKGTRLKQKQAPSQENV